MDSSRNIGGLIWFYYKGAYPGDWRFPRCAMPQVVIVVGMTGSANRRWRVWLITDISASGSIANYDGVHRKPAGHLPVRSPYLGPCRHGMFGGRELWRIIRKLIY